MGDTPTSADQSPEPRQASRVLVSEVQTREDNYRYSGAAGLIIGLSKQAAVILGTSRDGRAALISYAENGRPATRPLQLSRGSATSHVLSGTKQLSW